MRLIKNLEYNRLRQYIGIILVSITAILSIVLLLIEQPLFRTARPIELPFDTTIDGEMETAALALLDEALLNTQSEQGHILIMNTESAAVKAMVSSNTQHNCLLSKPDSCSIMQNLGIKDWEPGSVMKPLLLAATLNENAAHKDTAYYDEGFSYIDGRQIANVRPMQPRQVNVETIISSSLNTGAVFLLKQLGDNSIDQNARRTWQQYLQGAFMLDTKTGIGASNEEPGYIRPSRGGNDVRFRYAGSAFGVGLTTTPLRLAAAYAALINDGKYTDPFVHKGHARDPSHIAVSAETSSVSKLFLEKAIQKAKDGLSLPKKVRIGGKSGTAPLPDNDGFYRKDGESGTFVGFVEYEDQSYIILARLDAPKTTDIASTEAFELWGSVLQAVIN